MHVAARIAISLAIVPPCLALGAAVGHLGNLASGGNGWYLLIGMIPAAFFVGAVAPHRWAAPVVLTVLLGAYWVNAYADGDDSCEGRPLCEDNIGPRTTLVVPIGFVLAPMMLGALLQPKIRMPMPWSPAKA